MKTFKPDFIIIGSMKCATSAIYEYLCQHPKVWNRKPKEIHFYTQNHEKGLNWYLKYFQDKPEGCITGEASPSYFDNSYSIKIPKLILEDFPEVKIIVSLRNPTDRAISHFYHIQHKLGKLSEHDVGNYFSSDHISAFIENKVADLPPYLDGILKIGQYAKRLPYWLETYKPDQIIVINQAKLEQYEQQTMKEIFNFLNLEPLTEKKNYQKVYTNTYPETPKEVRKNLDAFYQADNQALQDLLGETFA